MSASTEERFFIAIILTIAMGVVSLVNKSYHLKTQSQLSCYQDSVNMLIEENKKLHAAQMSYSDAIVNAMTLQEVKHGTK